VFSVFSHAFFFVSRSDSLVTIDFVGPCVSFTLACHSLEVAERWYAGLTQAIAARIKETQPQNLNSGTTDKERSISVDFFHFFYLLFLYVVGCFDCSCLRSEERSGCYVFDGQRYEYDGKWLNGKVQRVLLVR
jgi:hypothetical protein